MARPSTKLLIARREHAAALARRADSEAEAIRAATQRQFLVRFKRDADFWYQAAVAIVMHQGTREDDPRVKIILAVLRSFLPEQRTFPGEGPATGPAGVVQVNVICPPGQQVDRGTAAARSHAIEIQAQKRQAIGESVPSGAPPAP